MSDIIQKLINQAKEHAREHIVDCKTYGYHMEDNEFEAQFESKLSELIVNACANWMENVQDEQGDIISDSFYWVNRMKEHFGVEL